MSPLARRAAAWLAGVWAGLIAGVGFVAAPVLFANLPRSDAGRVAARLFEVDAMLGLGVGALLLVLTLTSARRDSASGASRFSTEMMLVLATLFCIVAGHYGVQPMLETAGRGEGGPSFAVLHGVASTFFALKLVAVAVLAWRLAKASLAPAGDRATVAALTS